MYFLLVPLSAYVIQIGGTQFAGPNSVTVTFLNWTIWSLVSGQTLATGWAWSCKGPGLFLHCTEGGILDGGYSLM